MPSPASVTIITERPNEVWATGNTATVTVEDGQVTLFVTMDHCTTECVGIHAAKRATRFEALEPIRQAVRDYCGGFRADAPAGIRLRHDHGSQYMSDDFQAEIEISLFSRPCLGNRRIPDLRTLCQQARAWNCRVNSAGLTIDWNFDRQAARTLFKYDKNSINRSQH